MAPRGLEGGPPLLKMHKHGGVESRRPATLGFAYLLPPLSFGGASRAEPWSL
jgi:hypothetical protein